MYSGHCEVSHRFKCAGVNGKTSVRILLVTIPGRFQFTWANCDVEPSGPPTLLPTRSAGDRRNPCQRGQSQRVPQRLEAAVSGVELDSGVATASRLGTRLELGRTQQAGAQQVWTLSPIFFSICSDSLLSWYELKFCMAKVAPSSLQVTSTKIPAPVLGLLRL